MEAKTIVAFILCTTITLFVLCGCVKVVPQGQEKDGLPIFGAERSLFDVNDFTIEVDGETYSSAGDVGWYMPRESQLCGWIEYGGMEPAMLWCWEQSKQQGVCEVMITLENGMFRSLIYQKQGVEVPAVTAESVGRLLHQNGDKLTETDDRELIKALFADLDKWDARPQTNGVDDPTVEEQPGTFFIRCKEFPELSNSFFLLYDKEEQRYFVKYEFRKDLNPVLHQSGRYYRIAFISDEVAQKLLAF